jgi:hypothetical protein
MGQYAGGIVGYFANFTAEGSSITLLDVFSTGLIGPAAGGIVAPEAGYYSQDSSIMIGRAFSTGAIGVGAGGIVGPGFNDVATRSTIVITDVFTSGSISTPGGGIVAGLGSSVSVFGAYTSGASESRDNGLLESVGSNIVLNSLAESSSGLSGFTTVNFNQVSSGVVEWGAGTWGSCEVNELPFLQSFFDEDPCLRRAPRRPAVFVRGDGSGAANAVTRSRATPDRNGGLGIVNAITSGPGGDVLVFARPGALALSGRACVAADPCTVSNGWWGPGGGSQKRFKVSAVGVVRVGYRTSPGSAASVIGGFRITPRLAIRVSVKDGVARFTGSVSDLEGIGPLRVKTRRNGEGAFRTSATVTPQDGRFSWSRRFSGNARFEVYVRAARAESNRVTF